MPRFSLQFRQPVLHPGQEKMIRVIMFDLDGVLVNAQEWHYKALNRALQDVCKYEIEAEDHIENFDGLPTLVKLGKLESRGIVEQSQYDTIFNLKQHYTMNLIKEQCRPDIAKTNMLYQLSEYKKACITNSIYKTAYEMLVLAGLNYYLDYVQGNEATPFPKPNPSPYLHAMAKMGVRPGEVLIVEDSDKGYESGVKSGAHTIKVTYKELSYDFLIEKIARFA